MSETSTQLAALVRYPDLARGDFAHVSEALETLRAYGEVGAVHEATVRAYLWFADLPGGEIAPLSSIRQWLENVRDPAVFRLLVLYQHARLLAFDPVGIEQAATLARIFECADEVGRLHRRYVQLVAEASSLQAGLQAESPRFSEPKEPREQSAQDAGTLPKATAFERAEHESAVLSALGELFTQAKDHGMAALAVDIQTTLALALLVRGDLSKATAVARRASRMARTEGLPQQQYYANLLLARVRRLNGVPHLSTHILRALQPIASSPYQGWIAWESTLAGTLQSGTTETEPVERAVGALAALLRVATEDDPATLRQASDALQATVQEMALVQSEVRDLCVGLDRHLPKGEASGAMRQWLVGTTPLPPHGFYGVQSLSIHQNVEQGAEQDVVRSEAQRVGQSMNPNTDPTFAERDVGYVLVHPERPARRVLGLAAAPSSAFNLDDGRRTDRRRSRVETGLAVLALATEPMQEIVFFKEVYGFRFNAAIHAPVFDALVSRMRKALREVATLTRTEGTLHLVVQKAAALPDPRCAQPIAERILRVLVRSQEGSAKDAAARLGLPLRTVQEALKELTQGGACTKQREGRRIAYVVEDSTFDPPTQSGLRPGAS